ncbi:MAG: glycosyltransferase family 2 protein [Candidatus Omnitrophota bacterium]
MSLSIFFPAYNDSGTIASMVVTAVLTAREITDDFEIIVVNDCSGDGTEAILEELKKVYPQLKAIHHKKNRGYGGALKSGFSACSKDLIFYTDGDAQYDARELKVLYAKLKDDIDVVNGYKLSRSDPFYRALIGRSYHTLAKLLFGLKIRDVDCDFRLMRRRIFDRVKLEMDSGVICVEMVKKIQDAGFKFAEAPVHHYYRSYGGSQFFKIFNIYRALKDLLRLWKKLVWSKKYGRG